MISRKTARTLGEVYECLFRKAHARRSNSVYSHTSHTYYTVDNERLYDFLYDREYPAWFCGKARLIKSYSDTRPLKDFIMWLHTGQTQYDATPDWSWVQRQMLGQTQLVNLAKDILNYWHNTCEDSVKQRTAGIIEMLTRALELDSYVYQDSHLLMPEEDVLDTQEEAGTLETLFASLDLDNKDMVLHYLKLSEEHYLAQRWDDSISNSRKFFECVLQEVAAAHSIRHKRVQLPEGIYTKPVEVRDYLERESLIETREKEAIAKIYGLLSHTGGHPYMAQNDQARLLRHLALTISQFVMLRFRGKLASLREA